jgi:hypothetical protein
MTDVLLSAARRAETFPCTLELSAATATRRVCSCCSVSTLFLNTAAKEVHGVMQVQEKTLPVVVFGSLSDVLYQISSFAWLQPR